MNTTTRLSVLNPMTVHSEILGCLIAEISIANLKNPENKALRDLHAVAVQMQNDLREWRLNLPKEFGCSGLTMIYTLEEARLLAQNDCLRDAITNG